MYLFQQVNYALSMERDPCLRCFRVKHLCLCSSITPFEIEPLIVLLVHPREFKKTVGTVKIVKLSLTNSKLIRGSGLDFDQDPNFLSIISNPELYPMILFPGEDSLNLSTATPEILSSQIPKNKRLTVFVIDGTWTTAKQMIRRSKILSALPKLSFNVLTPSIYEFRKQPKEYCISTVEAVSVLIENLKQKNLCTVQPSDAHHQLIQSFRKLVDVQLKYLSKSASLTS